MQKELFIFAGRVALL